VSGWISPKGCVRYALLEGSLQGVSLLPWSCHQKNVSPSFIHSSCGSRQEDFQALGGGLLCSRDSSNAGERPPTQSIVNLRDTKECAPDRLTQSSSDNRRNHDEKVYTLAHFFCSFQERLTFLQVGNNNFLLFFLETIARLDTFVTERAKKVLCKSLFRRKVHFSSIGNQSRSTSEDAERIDLRAQ